MENHIHFHWHGINQQHPTNHGIDVDILKDNIEVLKKWVTEETNDHIRSMIQSVINTAETMIQYNHIGGIYDADVAVKKLVDIYNR